MASRKSKKHNHRETRRIHESFNRNRAARGSLPGTVIANPAGRSKMSEVLLDFIEPYREDAESEGDLRSLLSMGIGAWNVALLPKAEREDVINQVIAEGLMDEEDNFRRLANELIARKEKYFAHCPRFIFGYELTVGREGPHLTVLSALV